MMEDLTRDYMLQMANEISRLRAENEKLREALNEIATAKPAADGLELRAKWLQKAAAAALKETGDE